MLTETNSIYVYLIEVWWTGNKRHNDITVVKSERHFCFSENFSFHQRIQDWGTYIFGALFDFGGYTSNMFVAIKVTKICKDK